MASKHAMIKYNDQKTQSKDSLARMNNVIYNWAIAIDDYYGMYGDKSYSSIELRLLNVSVLLSDNCSTR